MIENLGEILLISGSIINVFVIAILIIKKKINIAIGLSIIQALVWLFRFMRVY